MYALYSGSEMSAAPGRVRLYEQIKAYRDLGGVHVWHAGVSWIESSRCAAWFTRAVAPVCRLRVFEGADAGRAGEVKRTPCHEGTMDATCRSVPQHLGTAVRVLWGCQAWAVGVCWRASFGKVEMQNESLRKRFRACSVEGCRCY